MPTALETETRNPFLRQRAAIAAVALALLGIHTDALAGDPKFDFGKPEEVEQVEWKAQVRGGIVTTSGNSRTTSGSGGFSASRKYKANKLAIDGGIAYVRSRILSASDANMSGFVDAGETSRVSKTTSNSWNVKARYDRFFTTNNSLYASAGIARDRPAGKELASGGQVGYSRQLLKNDRHVLLAELGYDFTFDRSVAGDAGVQIHSARVFAGETLTITKETGVTASVEVLTNLNEEKAPAPGYPTVAAADDLRAVGKLGLSTTLWKNVSFGFGATLKYDKAPAPLPPFAGLKFADAFRPTVETLDTIIEASLVVSFF